MCVCVGGTAAYLTKHLDFVNRGPAVEDYLLCSWDVKNTFFLYVALAPSSHPIMDSGCGPSAPLSKPYFSLMVLDSQIQSLPRGRAHM